MKNPIQSVQSKSKQPSVCKYQIVINAGMVYLL